MPGCARRKESPQALHFHELLGRACQLQRTVMIRYVRAYVRMLRRGTACTYVRTCDIALASSGSDCMHMFVAHQHDCHLFHRNAVEAQTLPGNEPRVCALGFALASQAAMASSSSGARSRAERQKNRSGQVPVGAVTQEEAIKKIARGADPSTVWGKEGRFGIYNANLGHIKRPDFRESAIAALQTVVSNLVAVQEATPELRSRMEEAGWVVTDSIFAQSRNEGGHGLLVCGKNPVERLQVTWDPRRSQGHSHNSSCMMVKATFRYGVAGVGEFTLGVLHIDKRLAAMGPKSAEWQQWVRDLAHGIRACGATALVGDANLFLFMMEPALRQHEVQATLVANHAEIDIHHKVNVMTVTSVRDNLLYDTCGIWMLRRLETCRVLTLGHRCILGALHSAYLEQGDANVLRPVCRGMPLTAFHGATAQWLLSRKMPSDGVLQNVLKLWDRHDLKQVQTDEEDVAYKWSMELHKEDDETWNLFREADVMEGEKRKVILANLDMYVRTHPIDRKLSTIPCQTNCPVLESSD